MSPSRDIHNSCTELVPLQIFVKWDVLHYSSKHLHIPSFTKGDCVVKNPYES